MRPILSKLRLKARIRQSGVPIARFPARGTRLTRQGFICLLVAMLVGLAAMNAHRNLLLIGFGTIMGGIVLSGLVGSVGRFAVRRSVPDSVMAGRPFTIRYELRNLSRWRSRYGIHLVELTPRGRMREVPEATAICIPPGETVTLTAPGVCVRRGRTRLQRLRLATQFPFGLLVKYTTVSIEQDIVVLPAVGHLKAQALQSAGKEAWTGGTMAGGAGGLDQFFGVRDHRPGDNPRWIHWRRSARTGQLVTREMERPQPRRLTVVLDTQSAGTGRRSDDLFEYNVSMAATLACSSIDEGLQVGLLCNGPSPVVVPPAASRRQSRPILHSLALVEPGGRADPMESTLAARFPGQWRGRCVLITARPLDELTGLEAELSRLVGPVTVWSTADGPLEDRFVPWRGDRPADGRPPDANDTARQRDGAWKGARS